jgi:hypothetical protein
LSRTARHRGAQTSSSQPKTGRFRDAAARSALSGFCRTKCVRLRTRARRLGCCIERHTAGPTIPSCQIIDRQTERRVVPDDDRT